MKLANKINWINNKFYGKNYYYLYSMTVLHILSIALYIFFPEIPLSVFYKLSFTPQANQEFISMLEIKTIHSFLYAYLFLGFILVLDCIFLYIIVSEFTPKWLSMKKIMIFESLIMITSFSIPIVRDIFIFLSVNTLIITLTYKLIKFTDDYMKRWNPFKYLLISSSYVYIIKLLLYPVITLITIFIDFNSL